MQSIVDLVVGLVKLGIFAAIVLGIIAIWGYNSLRKLAENVREAQSNVDVSLRKKISLVNQLIEVAKTYMDRESLVLMKISQDNTDQAMQQVYQQSGMLVSTIQGMAQKFPELKTSAQYTTLAPAIAQSEEDLQRYRMQCNATIKEYNSKRSGLPHALYAGFLGFKAAKYLELESVESTDASVQKQIISDDGDRLNQLLGMAGTRVIGATKTLAEQGKVLAEKAGTRIQAEMAARSLASASANAEYTYLNADRMPMGPVSRTELEELFASGVITTETDVLQSGSKTWTKFSELGALRKAAAQGSSS